MTTTIELKSAAAARLELLIGVEGLPAKVRTGCAAMIDMLRTPVRIGLFGFPGGRKRELLNVLCECELIDPELDWSTIELSYGDKVQTQAILEDGSTLALDEYPSGELLAHDPVLVRIATPVPALRGRRFLMVVSDASPQDLLGGLRWGAGQVDMALWCTQHWGDLEHQLWHMAPENLRDHGVLVLTGDPSAELPSRDLFETCFDLRSGDTGPLEDHIEKVIAEASEQGVLQAELYLQRYKDYLPEEAFDVVPAPALPVDPEPPAISAPDGAEVAPEKSDAVPTEARDDLSRLFQHVRSSAEALRQGVLKDKSDTTPADMIERVEDVLDGLSERAAEMDQLNDTWPELGTMFFEARDLALLLRMEGDVDQAKDAARLLQQVRQDIEMRLAA